VITQVQSAAAHADPASATFPSTPTSGSLLVAFTGERGGTTEANFTITGTGWTKRIGHNSQLSDAFARKTTVVWTKVAGASEPTNVQVDNATANAKRLMLLEFSGSTSWTFQASSSADTGAGSTSPLSTGNTPSTSGNQLIITFGTFRNEGAKGDD
jgi:hypothetical protein